MPKPLRSILHALRTRPRLVGSMVMFLLCVAFLPQAWLRSETTRLLFAWDLSVALYLALVFRMALKSTQESMRHRAITQAESKFVELVLVLLATLAALIAIFLQLSMAKPHAGTIKAVEVSLAVLTIFLAWALIHSMFALHYAHDYYESQAKGMPPGLLFPGTSDPEYGDFFYCAFIIGTSGQTADVSFVNKPLRRIALIHSVLSFLFNTTMLAMTINVAAGFL
jgi:uncharacterized membrane protein